MKYLESSGDSIKVMDIHYDPLLSLRTWARAEAGRLRKEQGLPPYPWKVELPMAVPLGVWCVECAAKGHECQAMIYLDRDVDSKNVPYCLDCANDRPCYFQKNNHVTAPTVFDVPKTSIPPRPITGHRKDDIEQVVIEDDGKTTSQDLATLHNVSVSTISRYRRLHGIKSKKDEFSDPPLREHPMRVDDPYKRLMTKKYPGVEQAVIDDGGQSKIPILAAKLKVKPWVISHYRSVNGVKQTHRETSRNTVEKQEKVKEDIPTKVELQKDYALPKDTPLPTLETGKVIAYKAVLADLENRKIELENLINCLRRLISVGEL